MTRAFVSIVITLLIFLASECYASPLYVVEKPGGVKVFTTRKPSGYRYRLFRPTRQRYSRMFRSSGRPRAIANSYNQIIKQLAKQHGVAVSLVKAVIHVESSFNPDATSPKGAMGLMQLMPATAERFGVNDAYEPAENLDGGVRYLSFLLKRYNGDRRLALAAYNAGEGVVDRLGDIPPYRETQEYVRKVLDTVSVYSCKSGSRDNC